MLKQHIKLRLLWFRVIQFNCDVNFVTSVNDVAFVLWLLRYYDILNDLLMSNIFCCTSNIHKQHLLIYFLRIQQCLTRVSHHVLTWFFVDDLFNKYPHWYTNMDNYLCTRSIVFFILIKCCNSFLLISQLLNQRIIIC